MRKYLTFTIVLIILSPLSCVWANIPNPYEIEAFRLRDIPSFRLNTFNNDAISHQSIFGTDTIITFWATWSPISKEDLMRLHENVKGKNIRLLAICIDKDKEKAERFITDIKTEGIVFAYDKDGEISKKVFKVFMVPTSIFVNKKGIIKEIYFGLQKWREIIR